MICVGVGVYKFGAFVGVGTGMGCAIGHRIFPLLTIYYLQNESKINLLDYIYLDNSRGLLSFIKIL
jgi:hypothetical protein